MLISIVVPIFNEQKNIALLYKELKKTLKNQNHEIIFVDDGSTDSSFKVLELINKKDKKVKVIKLRKNFGKASALQEGFRLSKGDIILTMDSDLQDDPKEIPKFINKIEEGYDFVNGWKVSKHAEHSMVSALFSKLFNKLTAVSTGIKLHDFNCPYKAYKKEVAKSTNLYGEMHRYIPLLINLKGFKMAEIKVKNFPRKHGKTKYRSSRILKGFFDLITINYLIKFKKKPLHLFGSIGLSLLGIGFLIGLYLTLKKFILEVPIGREPLLLLGVLLIILGVQFFSLGLVGETMISLNIPKEQDIIEKII